MFSTIVDVVIGLAFVFFVFSLLVSGINELVRKALNTRAKALWKSISQILDGREDDFHTTTPGVVLGSPEESVATTTATTGGPSLVQRLFDHPMIRSLDPARPKNQTRVHHIPNREFARAVIELLTPREGEGAGSPQWDRIRDEIEKLPASLQMQFELLYEEAGEDIVAFRNALENWFDTRMQAVSDWYKKRTRWALAAYGLVVAVLFNVSAITITSELYENDVVRDTVAALAEQSAAEFDAVEDCADRECVEREVGELLDTDLPIWWRECTDGGETARCGFENGGRTVASIAGFGVTAAALSMGASFWFTVLKRAAGHRREPGGGGNGA